MVYHVSTCAWALYESCMTCIYYPRSNLAFEMTLKNGPNTANSPKLQNLPFAQGEGVQTVCH